MLYNDIAELLQEIGLPYGYRAFEPEDAPAGPPFICYLLASGRPEPADNKNSVTLETLTLELYTDQKDPELEKQVESVLTARGLVFTREETWIESEKMQETVYTMEVVNNGK